MKSKWWKISLAALLSIVGIVCFSTIMGNSQPVPVLEPQQTATKTLQPPNLDGLHTLVNDYRKSLGLSQLKRNSKLDASALAKCNNMVKQNYWAHTAPDGSEPWSFISAQGIQYLGAGENLANNDRGIEDIIKRFKESKTHNDNLINPTFTDVGYAVCKPGVNKTFTNNFIVVQHLVQL